METAAADASERARSSSPVAEIEHQLDLLVRGGRRAARRRAEIVDPHLQPIGFSILVALVRGGSQSHGEVAESIGIEKTAMSKAVGQLQRLGLVEQRQDPSDRRARVLQATPQALERVDAALESRASHLRERFAEWSAEDLAALVDLLTRYNASDPGAR